MLTGQCWCFSKHETFPRLISPCALVMGSHDTKIKHTPFPERADCLWKGQECYISVYVDFPSCPKLLSWHLLHSLLLIPRQICKQKDKQASMMIGIKCMLLHRPNNNERCACACSDSQWLGLRCLSHFSWALV